MDGIESIGASTLPPAGVESGGDVGAPAREPESAPVALAAGGGYPDVVAVAGPAGRASDSSLLASVAAKLGALGDPDAMLAIAQSWMREVRMDERESGVRAGVIRADVASDARENAIAEAERNAAQRRE